MLVWELIIIVIVIYPHFQAPALYIHNYDTIYTGLLLISLLLHVHPSYYLSLASCYAVVTIISYSVSIITNGVV